MAESQVMEDFLTGNDVPSNLPYLHLSFFVHSFIPRRYVETLNPTKTQTVVGSFAEGLRLPAFVILKPDGTFAKKHLIKEPTVVFHHVKDAEIALPSVTDADSYHYVISTENVHAGYCRLKVLQNGSNESEADLSVTKKGIIYLGSSLSRKKFQSKISSNKKAIDSMLDTLINTGTGNGLDMKFSDIFTGIPEDSLDLRRPFTSQGLRGVLVSARQVKFKEIQSQEQTGLIPEVEQSEVMHELALHYPGWPSQAEEWRSRKRLQNWPSESTIEKVMSAGCHIVPSAHCKSSQSDIEWKISFSLAEKTLIIEELSDSQRQCFLLFNMLCVHVISEGMVTQQHIRSIFFYACENLGTSLWYKNPAYCVLYLLDQLVDAIKQKFLPDYFVKKNNLLDYLTDLQSSQLERRFTTIRRRPLEELFSLAENYTILDIFPYNTDVKKMFAQVLVDAKGYKSSSQAQKSVESFMLVCNGLCNGFYHEYGFDHCAAIFEDVIDNFVVPIYGKPEAERQREYIPHLLNEKNIEFSNVLETEEIWKPITFCRFLITRYVDGKKGAGLYEHLACLYHAASCVFKANKRDLLQKADAMFQEAMNREGEGHGAGLFVEYGHFLCSCEKYADAIKILRKAVESEIENPTSVNYYGKMESMTMDENLKKEISATGSIELLSIIYAYYLLIECFIRIKKEGDIITTVQDMEQMCNRVKDPRAYALLGYTLQKTKDKDKALGAFKCALDLDPKYKLAKENIAKHKKKK
ncbi:uncharacterized protein LOC133188944 [Saccostrea echinata]|uniref:uncharacterized protein LOC133188944 n=1 Tax=Saccostrea echinata TaxID=191078 RepID=UPI002A7FE27B|nr:uncharacterized protein LOC133188944 [Saccostrea echinata]